VSFSGKELTRQAVTENLNVLDYETYFTATDLILENKIPELLIQFNETLSKGFDGHHFIAGLASHFRDLLVCKTPQTISLLEVGEQTQKKYQGQSQKASQSFLMKGLELANDCDLKYKTSRNQRLLVELCLMQLASITFDGEKKNSKHFIIPASYFKAKGIAPIKVSKPNLEKINEQKTTTTVKKEILVAEPIKDYQSPEEESKESLPETPKIVTERPKIILNQEKKRVSGLSLSSIKKKKEHLIKQMDVTIDEEDLPNDDFTQEAMQSAWIDFVAKLEKEGKHNLASILSIDTPKLKGHNIHLEFPNATNKVEVERQQYDLMSHLRKSLNNYDISLSITVNEVMEKQYAYKPEDKYAKLKEKNPNIALLKKTFGLDI
jgi:DNA polymerase-3 subunit gamma/tau